MKEDLFEELTRKWIEGEISPEEGEQMAFLLREDPARTLQLQDELQFADLLEQGLSPWRSFDSFVNGLETRMQAEKSGDEFIRDLIPRLREVEEQEALANVVPMVLEDHPAAVSEPERRRPAHAARLALSGLAAAAALVVAITWGLRNLGPDAPLVARITGVEDVVWEEEAKPIEWSVGDDVKVGDDLRLRSGKARLRMPNGNVFVLEGPVDLKFLSESEGYLREGTVLANVRPGVEPFRFLGGGAEITVEPGATGVRTLEGDRMEATVFSSEVPDGKSLVADAEGKMEEVPSHGEAYKEHLPILTGIEETSDPVKLAVPGTLPHYKVEEGGPVLLVLEDDDLPQVSPIRVDVVPGANLDLSMASHTKLENRPAIESASRVRSYLVQVGDSGSDSGDDGDYVNATVRFDRPILGISATDDTLDIGDQLTGYDPKTLMGPRSAWKRGLKPYDFVQIREDGRTLDLRVRKEDAERLTQLRVFVEGD